MYCALYEDAFNVWFCVFIESGKQDYCCAVERIPINEGRGKDGSFSELWRSLQENEDAWREWRHSEPIPDLLFNRELAITCTQIALTKDVHEDWIFFDKLMSVRAAEIIKSCSGCEG